MKKLVVLGSGLGSNLQAILEAIQNQSLAMQPVGIISDQKESGVLQLAQNANIANYCLERRSFSHIDAFHQALLEQVSSLQPDIIALAGFMRILPDKFVHFFEGKLLNIHPSLLPKHKGLNTHQRVLAAQDEYHGTTIHFVSPELDSGAIIAQAKFKLPTGISIEQLQAQVKQWEHKLYPRVLNWFAHNRLCLNNNQVYLDNFQLPKTGIVFNACD